MSGSLLDEARRGVAWLRKKEPGLNAELFLSRGREEEIAFREGEPESVQETRQEGTGLRVLRDGRQGFAFLPGTGPEVVRELYERVRDHIGHLPPDPHRRLPAPDGAGAPPEGLCDPEVFRTPVRERIELLRRMEAEALALDPRVSRVLRSGFDESRSETALASTEGVEAADEGTYFSVGLAVAAQDGEEVLVGSASELKRVAADLDPSRAAKDSVERTASMIGAKRLPTARRDVLFDPWVAGEILDLVAGALSADQVQRGKSMLRGKLGQKVASERVTFVDDPRLPRGVASCAFDDEGVPTRRKVMVEAGILREFFYDTLTGAREGRPSNGSAGRGSYRGLPRPGPTNFFMAPGTLSRAALLADTRDGVLVREILGMHTADPVSGEFSVGVSGVAVRDGRLEGGVRGAMLSGNVLELLSGVDAVADDLTFYGSLSAPTFRVRALSVA